MEKNICFAYYADNQFIGWYGGTFGPVSNIPKVYTDSESQIDTITKNFNYKLKKINDSTLEEYLSKADNVNLAIQGLTFSSQDLLKGKKVELRIVECPFYDGPNPDFKVEEYKALSQKRRELMGQLNIWDKEISHERTELIRKFDEEHPELRYSIPHWISADYEKVKEWASKEPTEFINIIYYEKI